MANRKVKYSELSPLERSIFSRERAILRMKQNIARIRQDADGEINATESRIKEKQILLDALKRGRLKP